MYGTHKANTNNLSLSKSQSGDGYEHIYERSSLVKGVSPGRKLPSRNSAPTETPEKNDQVRSLEPTKSERVRKSWGAKLQKVHEVR